MWSYLQGENDLVASDTDEHASVQVRRDPCVLATLTSSEPVAFNAAETVGEHPEMNTVEVSWLSSSY